MWPTIVAIRQDEPFPLPSDVSPNMQELVHLMLNKDPALRPDTATLLQNEEIYACA